MALSVRPPIHKGSDAADEPEKGSGKVDPDGILHAPDVGVALGVLLVDVRAAE